MFRLGYLYLSTVPQRRRILQVVVSGTMRSARDFPTINGILTLWHLLARTHSRRPCIRSRLHQSRLDNLIISLDESMTMRAPIMTFALYLAACTGSATSECSCVIAVEVGYGSFCSRGSSLGGRVLHFEPYAGDQNVVALYETCSRRWDGGHDV